MLYVRDLITFLASTSWRARALLAHLSFLTISFLLRVFDTINITTLLIIPIQGEHTSIYIVYQTQHNSLCCGDVCMKRMDPEGITGVVAKAYPCV